MGSGVGSLKRGGGEPVVIEHDSTATDDMSLGTLKPYRPEQQRRQRQAPVATTQPQSVRWVSVIFDISGRGGIRVGEWLTELEKQTPVLAIHTVQFSDASLLVIAKVAA